MLSDRLAIAEKSGSRNGYLEMMGETGRWGFRLTVDSDCFEKSIGDYTFCEEWQTEPVVLTKTRIRLKIESDYIFLWSDGLGKAFPVVGNTNFRCGRRSETILKTWGKITESNVGFTFASDYGSFEDYLLVNPKQIFLEKSRRAEVMKMCHWLCRLRGDDKLIFSLAERWNDLCELP